MFDYFIKKSCKWGSNKIDWIRSSYYALAGSTLLNLVLKINTYNCVAGTFYSLCLLSFIVGIICSSKVADRLKNTEKDYEKEINIDKTTIRLPEYLFKKESLNKRYKIQHLGIYFIWLPAIIFNIIGALNETKSIEKSAELKNIIYHIEEKVINTDSIVQLIKIGDFESKLLIDSINLVKRNLIIKTKQIDSLKLENKLLKQRLKMALKIND